MMRRGSINTWSCRECGCFTITVHVDDGVTPMFVPCRRPLCRGMMASTGFDDGMSSAMFDVALQMVGWEWHRPSPAQMRAWRLARDPMYSACLGDGLVLRRLTDAGRRRLALKRERVSS